MAAPQRIGVFGGTFDPIHSAHLNIARAAIEAAHLDKVLFVVAAQPPHKRGGTIASPEERLAMVHAAVRSEPKMEACDVELYREGPSYTSDTLRALGEAMPGAELFLIIGQDSLADLPKWHDPEGILRRARLLVAPRAGESRPVPESLKGRYQLLPLEATAVSSTEVRRRLETGESLEGMAPSPVEELIRERGFYDGRI